MKTQAAKTIVKKRAVKKNLNDSFKGKLRGNINKLICLKEPQLLVKFGVEDIVPSRLVKSIIATSAKQKTSNLDKNLLTSTPYYTKVRDNVFFNTGSSTVFSPIIGKEKEHAIHNDSTESEICPPHQPRNDSSVIYVCPNEGDNNEKQGQDNASLKRNCAAAESPPHPPATKKSKIPIRTASQERDNATLNNSFSIETRGKHKNVRDTTQKRRSKSVPADNGEQSRDESNVTFRRGKKRRSPHKNDNSLADIEHGKVKSQKTEFANNIGLSPVAAKNTDRSLRTKQSKGKDKDVNTANNDVKSPKSVPSTDNPRSPTKEAPFRLNLIEEIMTRKKTLNKENYSLNEATAATATTSKSTQKPKQNKRKNATSPEKAPLVPREPQMNDTSLGMSLIEEIKSRKEALEAKRGPGIVSRGIQTSGHSNDAAATLNETTVNDVNKNNEPAESLSSLIEEMKSRISGQQRKRDGSRTVCAVSPVNKASQPAFKNAVSETTLTLGHVLSQQGMAYKMKKWDEFCSRLESLCRLRDECSQEGETDTSENTSKNRRFSKNADSPRNTSNKSARSGVVFGFLSSAKKRRSIASSVTVSPKEKRKSLHDLVQKIKSTHKTKKSRRRVNKEIQTTIREDNVGSVRAPLFRRSAMRKKLGGRSSGTLIEFGDCTPSSDNRTPDGPNIFDSLKEGNPADALDFSDVDGPDLTPIEKPWRFEDDNDSARSDFALNFLRPESIIRYTSLKSVEPSRRHRLSSSSSSGDESDLDLNNKTLTENDVSRASKTSHRKQYRRDFKKYDKGNKEAVKPVTALPSKRDSASASARLPKSPDNASKAVLENRDAVVHEASSHFEASKETEVSRILTRSSLKQSKKTDTRASNPAEAEANRIEIPLEQPTNQSTIAKTGRKHIDKPLQSPDKGMLSLRADTRQNNRMSTIPGLEQSCLQPTTPQAERSGKDDAIPSEATAKRRSKSKSTKKPASNPNNSVANANKPLSETTTKSSKSTKRTGHDENDGTCETVTTFPLPEQTVESTTSAADAKKGRNGGRNTKRFTGDVSAMNILTSKDGHRPQRTRKPVKYHTDIDIKACGYILASSVRTKKSSAAVAKRTKKNKKETNPPEGEDASPPLESQVFEPPVVDEQPEENRTNQNNASNTASKQFDNLSVAIVPLPNTSSASTRSRSRKKVVAESLDEKNNSSTKKSRADARRVNNAVDSLVHEDANSELQPIDDPQIMDNNIMPPPRIDRVGKSRGRKVRKKLVVDSGYENSDSEGSTSKGGSNSNSRNTGQTNRAGSILGCVLRSSMQSSTLHEGEQNAPHDFTGSQLLDRASIYSSALRPTATELDVNNESDFDGIRRKTSPRASDEFVRVIDNGQAYNFRYFSRVPSDSSFRQMGNLYISEKVVGPRGGYSAGFLRLDLGDQKTPTVCYKFSFIFVVIHGTAHIQIGDKRSVVNKGDFFHVPRGTNYSIKNANSQRDLLLHYTKIKGHDA